MDGFNFAPHLLADEAIIGMALGHGAELDHVLRFPRQLGVNAPLQIYAWFAGSCNALNLDFIRLFPQLSEIVRRL